MGTTEDYREFSPAWDHYKRTGVILPGYQGDIAQRLAEHNGRSEGRDGGEERAASGQIQA